MGRWRTAERDTRAAGLLRRLNDGLERVSRVIWPFVGMAVLVLRLVTHVPAR